MYLIERWEVSKANVAKMSLKHESYIFMNLFKLKPASSLTYTHEQEFKIELRAYHATYSWYAGAQSMRVYLDRLVFKG